MLAEQFAEIKGCSFWSKAQNCIRTRTHRGKLSLQQSNGRGGPLPAVQERPAEVPGIFMACNNAFEAQLTNRVVSWKLGSRRTLQRQGAPMPMQVVR